MANFRIQIQNLIMATLPLDLIDVGNIGSIYDYNYKHERALINQNDIDKPMR